ncbi:hypothetical protein BDZ91DRAFT_431988 [Kalaharituber pfeilii]|nr:hypothetical protein BDZ91DRAFT_431988 [Kalaharituber pfeilii]
MTPEGNIPIEQYIAYKPGKDGIPVPIFPQYQQQPASSKPMGRLSRPLSGLFNKDKDKEKDHDLTTPVTPPATGVSTSSGSTKVSSVGQSTAPSTPASSINAQQTKGNTVSHATPPNNEHRVSSKPSFMDLQQSLLGRFTPSPGSAHSTSPTPQTTDKKHKEDTTKKGSSKREKIRRWLSRRSDSGHRLHATISAEELGQAGELILPSNSSIESMRTRDIDLRSRASAESLQSNQDAPQRPKMVAREEKSPLLMRASKEDLNRSTPGLGFYPVKNLVEMDSEDESIGIRSPKRKSKMMNFGEGPSMIPLPVSKYAPSAGLSTILSAGTSASGSPTKSGSQSPAATQLPRPILHSPTSRSKAMKYGNLANDGNATIRPRLQRVRKASGALAEARVGIDASGTGFVTRPRSNSLPTLAGMSLDSDDEDSERGPNRNASRIPNKGKEKAKVDTESPAEAKTIDKPAVTPKEPEDEAPSSIEAIPGPEEIPLPTSPAITSPSINPLTSTMTAPVTSPVLSPVTPPNFSTVESEQPEVTTELEQWELKNEESSVADKRRSFESVVSNVSSGWTTDEEQSDNNRKATGITNIAPGAVTIGSTTEQQLKEQQEKMERVTKEVELVREQAEAVVRRAADRVASTTSGLEEQEMDQEEEEEEVKEEQMEKRDKETEQQIARTPVVSPVLAEALPFSPSKLPTSPKKSGREMRVESLDQLLEKMEDSRLESYLSPRLVPLPKESEQDVVEMQERDEEDEMSESVGLVGTKVAGSVLLDSPITSQILESTEADEETEEDEVVKDENKHDEDMKSDAKRHVVLTSSATQTDLPSPPPTPPSAAPEHAIPSSSTQTVSHPALEAILPTHLQGAALSAEFKAEVLQFLAEKIPSLVAETAVRKRSRTSKTRKISEISKVEEPGSEESQEPSTDEEVLATALKGKHTDRSPSIVTGAKLIGGTTSTSDVAATPIANGETKEAAPLSLTMVQPHQSTYLVYYPPLQKWLFRAFTLGMFIATIIVPLRFYLYLLHEHHECGFKENYLCLCGPECACWIFLPESC